MLDIFQTAVDSNRLKLLTKISNDLLKTLGIKDIGRLRKRTERCSWASELALNFPGRIWPANPGYNSGY